MSADISTQLLFLKCFGISAQRARSASRKRGHDETEEQPNLPGTSSGHRLQHQIGFNRTNLSSHGSPTSAKRYSSPPIHHIDPPLERSPPIVNAPSFAERWPYDGEPFPTSSQSVLPTGTYEPQSTVDPSFLGYCPPSSQISTDLFGTSNATTSGPLFVHTGLPFHGLDYLRNFDPDGGEKDALGQGFDAGAFQYDPEIPFSLPDLAADRTG